MPNEHIDGREVQVFTRSPRYKSVAYVPVDNPHLLESKYHTIVDGQDVLAGYTKWLSVETE